MLRVNIVVFVSMAVLVLVMCSNDFFRPLTVRFYVFGDKCSDYPNVPITYSNVKIQTISRTVYLSMKVHIKEDINSDDLQLNLFLKRCRSRDALDSCESYKTIKLNNFCNIMTNGNKTWSSFRSSFKPPLPGCPLKKGDYEVKNGTFDGSKLPSLPISNTYWKVKVVMKTLPDQRVVMCLLVEGQLAPV